MQWIINGKNSEVTNPIYSSLFPSAKFYILMNEPDYKKSIEESKMYKSNQFFRSYIKGRMMDIKSGFIKNEEGYFWNKEMKDVQIQNSELPAGIIGNSSLSERNIRFDDILKHQNKDGSYNKEGGIIMNGIDAVKNISLLNEKDQKIESEAMKAFMAAVALQMIPYLGTVASIPVDLRDAFTGEEATMAFLQDAGLVPKEYKMEKTWIDNILGGVSLVFSAFGAQAFIKSGKFGKALSKIKGFTMRDFIPVLQKVGKKTGVSSEAINNVSQYVKGEFVEKNVSKVPVKNETLNNKNLQKVSDTDFEKYIDTEIQKAFKDKDSDKIKYLQEMKNGATAFVDPQTGKILIRESAITGKPLSEAKQIIAHERSHQMMFTLPQSQRGIVSSKFSSKLDNLMPLIDSAYATRGTERQIGELVSHFNEFKKIPEQNRTPNQSAFLDKMDPIMQDLKNSGIDLTKPITATRESRVSGDDMVPDGDMALAAQMSRSPSDTMRNTTRMEISEVQRNTDVLAVGDLHGNFGVYRTNLESLGAVNRDGDWTGGNKKIVFHGDILADRNTQGTDILEDIARLREQAKKEGGDIIVLAGNHDDWALAYLGNTKASMDNSPTTLAILNNDQGKGIIEFSNKFMNTDFQDVYDLFQSSISNKDILTSMKKTTEGMRLLQQMTEFKIIEHIDDTLFMHTNASEKMMDMILTHGVDTINNTYQEGLRDMLLNNKAPSKGYKEITDIFLDTNTRDSDFVQNQGEALKDIGINRIIHGHTNENGKIITTGGVEVHSVDYNVGKGGESGIESNEQSIGVIRTNGDFDTHDVVMSKKEQQVEVLKKAELDLDNMKQVPSNPLKENSPESQYYLTLEEFTHSTNTKITDQLSGTPYKDTLEPTNYDSRTVDIRKVKNNSGILIREHKLLKNENLTNIAKETLEGEKSFNDLSKNYGVKIIDMNSVIGKNEKGDLTIFTTVEKINGKDLSYIKYLPTEAKNELDALHQSLGRHYYDAWKNNTSYWADCNNGQFVYGNKDGEIDKHFYVVDVGAEFYRQGEKKYHPLEWVLHNTIDGLIKSEGKFKPRVRLDKARKELLEIVNEMLQKKPDDKWLLKSKSMLEDIRVIRLGKEAIWKTKEFLGWKTEELSDWAKELFGKQKNIQDSIKQEVPLNKPNRFKVTSFNEGTLEPLAPLTFQYKEPIQITLSDEKFILSKKDQGFILKDSEGQEFLLENGDTIGHKPVTNNIVRENTEISSEHLKIEIDGNNIRLTDLDSINGSHVETLKKESQAGSADDMNLAANVKNDEYISDSSKDSLTEINKLQKAQKDKEFITKMNKNPNLLRANSFTEKKLLNDMKNSFNGKEYFNDIVNIGNSFPLSNTSDNVLEYQTALKDMQKQLQNIKEEALGDIEDFNNFKEDHLTNTDSSAFLFPNGDFYVLATSDNQKLKIYSPEVSDVKIERSQSLMKEVELALKNIDPIALNKAKLKEEAGELKSALLGAEKTLEKYEKELKVLQKGSYKGALNPSVETQQEAIKRRTFELGQDIPYTKNEIDSLNKKLDQLKTIERNVYFRSIDDIKFSLDSIPKVPNPLEKMEVYMDNKKLLQSNILKYEQRKKDTPKEFTASQDLLNEKIKESNSLIKRVDEEMNDLKNSKQYIKEKTKLEKQLGKAMIDDLKNAEGGALDDIKKPTAPEPYISNNPQAPSIDDITKQTIENKVENTKNDSIKNEYNRTLWENNGLFKKEKSVKTPEPIKQETAKNTKKIETITHVTDFLESIKIQDKLNANKENIKLLKDQYKGMSKEIKEGIDDIDKDIKITLLSIKVEGEGVGKIKTMTQFKNYIKENNLDSNITKKISELDTQKSNLVNEKNDAQKVYYNKMAPLKKERKSMITQLTKVFPLEKGTTISYSPKIKKNEAQREAQEVTFIGINENSGEIIIKDNKTNREYATPHIEGFSHKEEVPSEKLKNNNEKSESVLTHEQLQEKYKTLYEKRLSVIHEYRSAKKQWKEGVAIKQQQKEMEKLSPDFMNDNVVQRKFGKLLKEQVLIEQNLKDLEKTFKEETQGLRQEMKIIEKNLGEENVPTLTDKVVLEKITQNAAKEAKEFSSAQILEKILKISKNNIKMPYEQFLKTANLKPSHQALVMAILVTAGLSVSDVFTEVGPIANANESLVNSEITNQHQANTENKMNKTVLSQQASDSISPIQNQNKETQTIEIQSRLILTLANQLPDDFTFTKEKRTPKNVKIIQQILKEYKIDIGDYGASSDGVDGQYGKSTLAGVKELQIKLNTGKTAPPLKEDGKFGKNTLAALKITKK
jgi:hypothetical protein